MVGAGDLYVLSASSNQILLDTTTSGTIVGIAISKDSKFAYALSNAPFGSIVTQINLVTKTKLSSTLALSGGATSISFAPTTTCRVASTSGACCGRSATSSKIAPRCRAGTLTMPRPSRPSRRRGEVELTPAGLTNSGKHRAFTASNLTRCALCFPRVEAMTLQIGNPP